MIHNFRFKLDEYKIDDSTPPKEGRYGKVYKIVHSNDNNKIFAAKSYKRDTTNDNEQIKILNEIDVLSQVKNPALITYVGSCLHSPENTPQITIITDYYPYVLSDLLNKKRIPPSKRYIILIGIIEGMKFLHSKNIVHRDLNPNNILLDENYYPYICDFGESKIVDTLNVPDLMKTFTGSGLYRAPEIIPGNTYNYKVDVYSFGMLLLILLTNQDPNAVSNQLFKDKSIPGLSNIENEPIKHILSICISELPTNRPDFSKIYEIFQDKSIRDYLGADDNEVSKYLSKFEDTLNTNSKSVTEIIKENAQLDDFYSIIQYAHILKEEGSIEASEYFKKAADKGDIDSMIEYALLLNNSNNSSEYINEIREYFEKAIINNNDIAMLKFARILYQDSKIFYNQVLNNGIEYKVFFKNKTVDNHDENNTLYNKKVFDKNYCMCLLEMSSGLGNSEAFREYLNITYNDPDYKIYDQLDFSKFYTMCSLRGNVEAIEFVASIMEKDKTKFNDAIQLYKYAADKFDSSFSMNKYASLVLKSNSTDKVSEATKYYLKAIDKGNVEANRNYARLMNEDNNRESNLDKIEEYFKKASDQGDAQAMLDYYNFVTRNKRENKDEALTMLERSSNSGFALAMKHFADEIARNEIEGIDPSFAIVQYKKAGLNGDITSMRIYANKVRGDIICNPAETPKELPPYKVSLLPDNKFGERKLNETDKFEALNCYRMLSDRGDLDSTFFYAQMLYNGECFPAQKKEAFRFFKKAALLGHPGAMCYYAKMCYEGDVIDVNFQEAVYYFEMAAGLGDINGNINLAHIFYKGNNEIPVKKDFAAVHFKYAADDGDIESSYFYAKMLYSGDGIKENKAQSLTYYKKAADNGNLNSMTSYASMCRDGIGIEKNLQEAANYYKKAADEKGDIKSMISYANLKYDSKIKDYSEAANYYKKAADSGNNIDCINAMFFYGLLKYFGCGNQVQVDKKEAAIYFKKAADLNHIEAMRNYASMLLNADGIDLDNKQATHYTYLCAQSRCTQNPNNYPKIFMEEFNKISKKISLKNKTIPKLPEELKLSQY